MRRSVKCPSCGHENRAAARFCDSCGARIGEATSSPDPRTYTPPHLAEKILSAAGTLEGERKQVTVLFADVQGSMDLQQAVDPEEWHRLMSRFFSILCDGVMRFEGTVDKFTGDGIMAIFGAPIAHEDHARRACYAALHLLDELARYSTELRRRQGLNFSVRMGLNSGDVVVGRVGEDLRMEYTALGQTVGLAQRIEQLAAPDSAFVTEHTANLVEGYLDLRDLGPFDIKGVPRPVRVSRLEGAGAMRTRLDVSRARGLTPFVGREREMSILEEALSRAAGGDGCAVGVAAEPGIGKSRLCYEFVQRCRARGILVREVHAVPHGKAAPFLPVLQLLRDFFGIAERDTDQTAREKVAGRALLLDESLREGLPILFDFLGIPDPERPAPRMEPEARQRELLGVVGRLVQARSGREQAVFLLDDLHWIDPGSETFVNFFIEALPGTRTLALVNFRPEYRAPWMERQFCSQISLDPLGPETTAALLRALLGDDPSLRELSDRIWEGTAGNPFFMEEVVQSLVDAGALEGSKGSYRLTHPVEEIALPPTVEAVVAARIDRLGAVEKGLLQAASVIGKEFSEPLLARVSGLSETELAAPLRAVSGGEFLFQSEMYPVASYAFRHPLTREVAYRSLLAERRGSLHAAAARALAEAEPERADERAAMIAHHFEAAGEWMEAARWSARAARWAGANDLSEALRHWRAVRALLDRSPPSHEAEALGVMARIQILRMGWRAGIAEAEAASVFREARVMAERGGNLRLLAVLLHVQGMVAVAAGDTAGGAATLLEAWGRARETGDAGLIAAVSMAALVGNYVTGCLDEIEAVVRDFIAPLADTPDVGADVYGFSPYVGHLFFTVFALTDRGRFEEAASRAQRALTLGRERGEIESVGWAHGVMSYAAWWIGDASLGTARGRDALDVAARTGNATMEVQALTGLGCGHLLREEWNEARDLLERALALARERRADLMSEPLIMSFLTQAQIGRRETAEALATAERGVELARDASPIYRVDASIALARALLAHDGGSARGRIAEALAEAQALVDETGAVSRTPFIHEARADLARALGDADAVERELREAHRLFAELGATGHAERTAALLGAPARDATV